MLTPLPRRERVSMVVPHAAGIRCDGAGRPPYPKNLSKPICAIWPGGCADG